ncbi:uncharacterized protein EI90DRAFT_3018700, partial [Cantharellus anzutake]|uniref:uncharacterized protein n=1 Tax=Cantharellus anzutake TaxID=1750568 RepID=UPI00190835DD
MLVPDSINVAKHVDLICTQTLFPNEFSRGSRIVFLLKEDEDYVGEANTAPIDPDPIRSPNVPPDELDSFRVVADTEAPAAITADLDLTPIDTETQSAVRSTGPSAPVPLLPTQVGDLPLSVVAPREDVPWREFIQTFVPEGPSEPASTVPGRTLDPTRASKQMLCDQGTFPMVTMTWNLHDDNGLPKFVHVPGSGDPGMQMATIYPDPESEESASSLAWIPSHWKENGSSDSDNADVEAGLPRISCHGTGLAIVVNQRGEIKRKQRHLFATPAPSEASKEYRMRVDDDVAYVYMPHGLESEHQGHARELESRLNTYRQFKAQVPPGGGDSDAATFFGLNWPSKQHEQEQELRQEVLTPQPTVRHMPGPQVEALINLISPVKREFSNNLNPLRVMSSIVPRMYDPWRPGGFQGQSCKKGIEPCKGSYPNTSPSRCKTRVTEKELCAIPHHFVVWGNDLEKFENWL